MKRHLLKPDAVERARLLRRNSTPAEALLWRALREGMANEKWRRQVPIGPYFADFASHRAKLIIEVDGSQHAEAIAADHARTSFLKSQGYRVLRFWNNEVTQNLDGVFAAIAAALPSPLVGEGGSKSRMRGTSLTGQKPLTPCPLPQLGSHESTTFVGPHGEREIMTKSKILET
ncbi:endonuclease domain-containing protein [Sphingomonas sp.]|uniref:endonuclease domain-containing protein n=1 Tax=Sphingomonas sp. TaxID=28214 RepID=UPI00286BEBA8|nr:endonuclease domain-containing protein [Sphingomonas sp.]